MIDERYMRIRNRWVQLSNEQLVRVLKTQNLCYDTFNFDERTGFF